jgi:hypothetical protein
MADPVSEVTDSVHLAGVPQSISRPVVSGRPTFDPDKHMKCLSLPPLDVVTGVRGSEHEADHSYYLS